MQSKGINLLWIAYSILIAIILVVSMQDCIRFVPTAYEGLPPVESNDEKQTYYSGTGEIISLPEPSYYSLDKRIAVPCALCCILFFFKKRMLAVLGNILAFAQIVIVACSGRLFDTISNAMKSNSCSIGKLHGYHELTDVGFIVLFLSVLALALSIVMSIAYAKEKKKQGDF